MLSCHLDESSDSRNLIVAGFLGGKQDWEFFEHEWLKVLKDYKVESPFKMQHWQMRKKVFRTMPEQIRRALLNELLGVISTRAIMAIGAAISLSDYASVFLEQEMKQRVGTPYCLAVQGCISQVGRWARLYSHNERIGYILDRGHVHATEALLAYKECIADKPSAEKHRVGPLAFEDDRIAIPLQAADLVAYEAMRSQQRQPLTVQNIRYPFEQLFRTMPVRIRIFDNQVLTELREAEEKRRPLKHKSATA